MNRPNMKLPCYEKGRASSDTSFARDHRSWRKIGRARWVATKAGLVTRLLVYLPSKHGRDWTTADMVPTTWNAECVALGELPARRQY